MKYGVMSEGKVSGSRTAAGKAKVKVKVSGASRVEG